MATEHRPAPIVAELGRAETPAEATARKAESSRKYRQRKTLQNLLAALGVSVLLMFVIVLVVPRNDREELPNVDYTAAAVEAQPMVDAPLVVPALGANWVANTAEVRTGYDKVTEWVIGLLRVEDGRAAEFVGVREGVGANATWTYDKVGNRTPTGAVEVGGVQWDEYDYTDLDADDVGNNRYSLVAVRGQVTYIVYGSGSPESVRAVAEAIADQIPAV